ncbi:host attachment protein [Opitutus terrae]|uniref:Host attachment protein n=1 Tax=Opitutus terrae (strain DSM 11246 / JCM 15787 / PB90-1) TaxID=452637 RepID=B1ZQV4_OPITP|nr:host attachment protein [Opitutus terrae]ACB77852.1 hypothetical protein Oter_4581 [Opitutus terrae PB90-1]
MSEHYVVTANQGHLRIFQRRQAPTQMTPAFDEVRAFDFPLGVTGYTDRDTDIAGRFQGSRPQGVAPGAPAARTGMSVDERLPMRREEHRRRIRDVAQALDTFFATRPNATWDFAAGPELHNAVLEAVTPKTRAQLRRSVPKDLVHQPQAEFATHFATH